MTLSEQQSALETFWRTRGRMPSYREAADIFGVASKDSAFRIIKKLIDLGSIKKDATGKIIPATMLESSIKILGAVEAGFPTPAEENLLDTITLDSYIIRNRAASFMLRVKGDSMKDAGILDGDFVIVERTTTATVGAIVIAEVDGAWTMKYLRKKNGRPYLEAANPDYPPIHPKGSLSITATVRAVIRKYA